MTKVERTTHLARAYIKSWLERTDNILPPEILAEIADCILQHEKNELPFMTQVVIAVAAKLKEPKS